MRKIEIVGRFKFRMFKRDLGFVVRRERIEDDLRDAVLKAVKYLPGGLQLPGQVFTPGDLRDGIAGFLVALVSGAFVGFAACSLLVVSRRR